MKCMKRCISKGLLVLFLSIIAIASVAWAEEPSRKTLSIKVGGTQIIESLNAVTRASVINPDIADIVIISPKELYAYGKQPGYTTVILWEEGKKKTLLDVVVSLDLTALKEKLHQLFPDEKIEVHGSETGVVLSGLVSGPEVMESVLRLTRTFLPKLAEGEKSSGGTGKSGDGITNLLRIGGIQQVLLEVKFAEVSRTSNKNVQAAIALENLGKDFAGAIGVGTLSEFPSLTTLLLNWQDNAANIFVKIDNFNMALQLLETEGLARILAEPRLVTQSGKEASFLAGGEYPIPVPQGLNEISIDFKEFGVALRFTPIVMSDGKISLRVAPSVSQISSVGSVPSGIVGADFVVPTFSTRKLDTTVELYDGQTIALAGLLQDDLQEQVNKVPGLGNIPILGQLFRSTSYQQKKTDLLIAVTPHLVKPVKEGDLKFPGENMKLPNAYEFYLEGRLEGHRIGDSSYLSKHEFLGLSTIEPTGGMEGSFGHQPVQGLQEEIKQ